MIATNRISQGEFASLRIATRPSIRYRTLPFAGAAANLDN